MRIGQTRRKKQEEALARKHDAGLVAERFPGVSSIVFRMTYYQTAIDRVLMTRTLSFGPANHACFHMDCLRDECTNGGFDLTPVVDGLVKGRKRSTKGNLYCKGKNDALRLGHASLTYEVNIEYGR